MLENDLKQLTAYKSNYEKLEAELNLLKSSRTSESKKIEASQREISDKIERLESENANLKNKIRDLDTLVVEYDAKYNDIKAKEHELESQNKHLENELDRMSEARARLEETIENNNNGNAIKLIQMCQFICITNVNASMQ